jgi:hypothetical protein
MAKNSKTNLEVDNFTYIDRKSTGLGPEIGVDYFK